MGRNEDRLGATPDNSSPMVEPAQGSQGLNFATPTEFVPLPSEGKYYHENHPLHGVSEVEIRFMTAKEEDILATPSYIKKGIVIDKMLESILVDKRIKLEDLLIGDKNALILAARITGFGEEYPATVSCPSCGVTKEHTFDLSLIVNNAGNSENLTPQGLISITLPQTKVKVLCKLLTGRDERALTSLLESKKKNKMIHSPMTDQLKQIISSINGDDNALVVNRFIETMPMKDTRFLRAEYKKAIPDVEMRQSFVCEACETESEVVVPLGPSFFWNNG